MSGMFDTKTDKAKRKRELTQKEQTAKRKSRIITTIAITAFILIVAFAIVLNSGWLRRTVPVVTIGDVQYSTAQFEYYYNNEYMNLANQYDQQGIGYIIPDRSKSLARHMYDESTGMTWADMITARALGTMRDLTAICNKAASDNRFKLSEDRLSEIDYMIMMHEFEAIQRGFPSVELYMQAMYGTGMSMPLYREILEYSFIAEDYTMFIRDNFEYTEQHLDDYYAQNADDFDSFNYRAFVVTAEYPGEDAEDFEAEREVLINEAREIARSAVTSVTDEESFITLALEYDEFAYAAPGSTLRQVQGEYLDNPGNSDMYFAQWLSEPGRKSGDVTAIDVPDGAAIVYFVSRDNNHYKTVGMRQLLFTAESVISDDFEQGESDPLYIEAVQQAENDLTERAQMVETLFIEAGATEDALISLREEYSDPDGSDDGLFEDIAKLSYQGINVTAMKVVPELEQWLFEDNRDVGDSALIKTDYGYHLVYFTGFGNYFSRLMAEDRLRSESLDEWFEALDFDEPVKTRAFILVST